MPLFDPLHRQIDYLRISVTDRCNLSCLYCKPRAQVRMLEHSDVLRYEEILRIASMAARMGISHMRVTGGEPLLRRGVVDFIGELSSRDGVEDVSITTNGVLLAERVRELRSAGVKRLNISLDTLDPARFRKINGSDDWDRVWRGIAAAEEQGFSPIKINMVPVRGVNDDEIVAFARLTLERAVHVRFIEFMPLGAGDRWHREMCVAGAEARSAVEAAFGRLAPWRAGRSAGPSDNYQIPGARGVVGFISPITKHFCEGCRRLRLTADGRIRPCLLSDTEIDLKAPLRGRCSDEELERLLRLSLEVKPERHYMVDGAFSEDQCGRTMSRIGG